MEALKELILICLTGWFSTGVTTKQSPTLTDSLSFYDNCHLVSTIFFQFLLLFSVFNPVPFSALGLHNRVVQFRHVLESEVLGISHSIRHNIKKQFQNEVLKFFFVLWRYMVFRISMRFAGLFGSISGRNVPVTFDLSNVERGPRSNF